MKIAIDFDGTIAQYDGWQGADVCGDPIPGALAFMEQLVEWGYKPWIFSARAVDGADAIAKWVETHGFGHVVFGITHEKSYQFVAFVDDRAHRFTGRYGDLLDALGPRRRPVPPKNREISNTGRHIKNPSPGCVCGCRKCAIDRVMPSPGSRKMGSV